MCCQTNANQSRLPYPHLLISSEKAASLCESGGPGQPVSVAVLEVALRRKVVVDPGIYWGELLQRSHAPDILD